MSGGDGEKVTPVPIPNTEVKLLSADGSWGRRPCESRTLPGFAPLGLLFCQFYKWPVGQGVKTPPFHGGNRGSNPLRVTIYTSMEV